MITATLPIKSVVFDMGNVLVRWAPHDVIEEVFPDYNPITFYQQIHPHWLDLNLGRITEKEAIYLYHNQLAIPKDQIQHFLYKLKLAQTPIHGTLELLQKLTEIKVPLYMITDNIKEFIDYHRVHSAFMNYFKDIIVSADLGILKPDPRIYHHLLKKHNLVPSESVFFDDLIANVEGALSVGMHAFQFTDTRSCEEKLIELGVF